MERSAVVINASPFNDISQSSYPRVAPKSATRDISFSSYLPRPDQSETSFEHPPPRLTHRVVITAGDAELSIFDAEKYFNETDEQKTPASQPLSLERIGEKSDLERPSSVSSVDGYGRNHKAAPFHAIPTASSEASWNSQSGLLSKPPGSMAISMRHIHLSNPKMCPNSPRRWFFRRKCPCSGNKSVDVEEKSYRQIGHTTNNSDSDCTSNNHHGNQSMGGADQEEPAKRPMVRISAEEWMKDESPTCGHRALSTGIGQRAAAARPFSDGGGFTFPILSHQMATADSPDDPPRESLEVFRPSPLLAAEEAMMPRRKAAAAPLYPSDVGRRSFTFATSPRRRGEDDVGSDSSSDLFEIESFSTSTGGGGASAAAAMYRPRDSLDELVRSGAGQGPYRYSLDETSTTITSLGAEAYEPSEASVEWSVVTAEGFDRGSVANFSASEFGETRMADLPDVGERATTTLGVDGGGKKKGGFLSCRCEKAVSVGPQPVKQQGTGRGAGGLSTNRHHHQHYNDNDDDDDNDDEDTSIVHIINNNINNKKKMQMELGREASLIASLAVHGGGRSLHVNTKPPLPRSNSARLRGRPFVPR